VHDHRFRFRHLERRLVVGINALRSLGAQAHSAPRFNRPDSIRIGDGFALPRLAGSSALCDSGIARRCSIGSGIGSEFWRNACPARSILRRARRPARSGVSRVASREIATLVVVAEIERSACSQRERSPSLRSR
jgi:hypothetical protein